MENTCVIARFYCFADFPDFADWQGRLKGLMAAGDVKGTILLAPEGVNGTIAGPRMGVEEVFAPLFADGRFAALDPKYTPSTKVPFQKIKVRLKPEIVTFKQPIDINQVGHYVEPRDWNALISDPNTITIDTRNDYEIYYGQFKGAIDPETDKFSELPEWVARNHNRLAGKKIAMYCTGGIRCEKSTAWMRSQGYEEVYHLRGGILGYMEQIPAEQSLWEGQCFVFDEREVV